MLYKRIAKTTKGYIGLVPGIAEVGDYISLSKGGKMPLVIRPQGSDWELISDSYIHRIVQGKA